MHEFNSPTYTYVQVTSLYTGYILTTNETVRGYFEYAIDLIWVRVNVSLSVSADPNCSTVANNYHLRMNGVARKRQSFPFPHCDGLQLL